jgi:hypothetical protein
LFPFVGGVSVPDPVVLVTPSCLLGTELIDSFFDESSLLMPLNFLKRFVRKDMLAGVGSGGYSFDGGVGVARTINILLTAKRESRRMRLQADD